MLKTNYHTHTFYCDGKGSPEEIIEEAMKKGFDIIGFSSHSAFPFGSDWHIAPRKIQEYMKDVKRAAENNKEKIKVLCGFEADYIPGITKPSLSGDYSFLKPDFLIGAVHYLVTKDGNFTVDDSAENVKNGLERFFFGNGKKCVQEYFYLEREMLKKGDFTILAHADLIRKRNGVLDFFSENENWYRNEIRETAKAASKAGIIAEINTGAISRGAMDDVYPSKEFLSFLHDFKVPVTFSSDAHEKENLDFAFERAMKAALSAGYTESAFLDENGKVQFQKIEIQKN